MSQTNPFGQPPVGEASGPVDDGPALPAAPAAAEKASRTPLIIIGATAVALAAAAGGYFLLSGGSDDVPPVAGVVITPTASATTTTTPTPSLTPLPTESTVNARNPFLPAPTGDGTGGTVGTSGSTTPTTAATAAPTTATETVRVEVTTTVTESSDDVFVTLLGFDEDDGHATFRVISPNEIGKVSWPVEPGDSFGKPIGGSSARPFTYMGKVFSGSKTCASVKFVDATPTTVCQGKIVQVQ